MSERLRDPNREKDAQLRALLYSERIEWRPARFDDFEGSWIVYPPDDAWPYWHPCYELSIGDDGEPVLDVVPLYTADIEAACDAESDLREEHWPVYLPELMELTKGNITVSAPLIGMWEREINLRLAKPKQIVEAMLRGPWCRSR